MSVTEIESKDATSDVYVASIDMRLEAAVIRVLDVDRAKEFYGRLGWRLDADFASGHNSRLVQFTLRLRVLGPVRCKPVRTRRRVSRGRFGPRAYT